MFEGWMPMPAGVDRTSISDHLVRISDAVPADVELGYHFCFGDFGHVHMREPEDTGRIVELIASFVDRVSRPIQWIHIPVPIERDDDAYFEPLRQLSVPEGTEVYLGLIHYRDGVDGARRRAHTAQRFIRTFGVATDGAEWDAGPRTAAARPTRCHSSSPSTPRSPRPCARDRQGAGRARSSRRSRADQRRLGRRDAAVALGAQAGDLAQHDVARLQPAVAVVTGVTCGRTGEDQIPGVSEATVEA